MLSLSTMDLNLKSLNSKIFHFYKTKKRKLKHNSPHFMLDLFTMSSFIQSIKHAHRDIPTVLTFVSASVANLLNMKDILEILCCLKYKLKKKID